MRTRFWTRTATMAVAAGLVLAGCGAGGDGNDEGGSDDAACRNYPSKDIDFVVPYAAGGGFDAWARLMEPYLEKNLGGEIDVRVTNVDGGGGMRAMNEIFAAPPDGTKIVFTEPGFATVNQILGRTTGDFDIRDLTYLGRATIDPQVFAVAADSDVSSIEDLEGQSVKHAGQDISPIETIVYDTFGIKGDFILHDATSETVLAVRRGDSDITVSSLSSMLQYLGEDQLKPILFVGTEEVNEDLLGYDKLKGVETITDVGHEELGAVLEQYRVVAGPPEMPECMSTILSDAVSKTLADEKFVAEAEKAELRVIPEGADETTTRIADIYSTFEKYADALKRALGEG